jgi:radical SAM protein with 4Fe4S-binding SPASM domain
MKGKNKKQNENKICNLNVHNKQKNIIIQWHITHKCNNNCKHCYEKNYPQNEILNFKELKIIFNKIKNFEQKYKKEITIKDIAITGGNPLLHPDCFDFIKFLIENKMRVHILGNPENLTKEILNQLSGVVLYQVSLDGMQIFHDSLRYKGSFETTIKALYELRNNNIKTGFMFTLFEENKNDLLPLIDFLRDAEIPVDYFAFDFGILYKEKNKEKDKILSNKLNTEDLKNIFNAYLDRVSDPSYKFKLLLKHPYLKIMQLQRKKINFKPNKQNICDGGCLIGYSFVIFSQGNMGLCARLPQFIGNALTDDIKDIFLNNEIIKKFRKKENFPQCKKCKYFSICRGCPALGKSITGDMFRSDAFCFLFESLE